MPKYILFCLVMWMTLPAIGKHQGFTRQDSLRGSITPERLWWDLLHYHLDIRVDPADSTIAGKNTITFQTLDSPVRMQIDLQPPMRIDSVVFHHRAQSFVRDGNAWFVSLDQIPESVDHIVVYYSGKPRVAIRPPWDGGIVWDTDSTANPFVASACQGIGASVWWPCKDHMYDEPDSMRISVRVPQGLMNVSNGRLAGTDEHNDKTVTYHWEVTNPINNYGVNINIGDYIHFTDTFPGENGPLSCDYYVLRQDFEKAETYFPYEAHRTLAALEHWFGPYPFYSDGYKLVHAPYLGMEHQSSVTYGNGFERGYLGIDMSRSGWGMKFDFIIVHESGHEWFANNITYRDMADMWIHEAFAAYSEALFVEFYYGQDAGAEYITGTRANVKNDAPIIARYGVNEAGSTDMYYKGANMLHTIRQLMDNDDAWRKMLRQINTDFRHQTVSTAEIEQYLSDAVGHDLLPIFNQYLRDVRIPVLQYYVDGGKLYYQWVNCVEEFDMPVVLWVNDDTLRLAPTVHWQSVRLEKKKPLIQLNDDYYVTIRKISAPE